MTGHNARVRTSVAIPIRDGIRVRFVTFDGLANQGEHFALCFGDLADLGTAPLVRMHSECVTGDVFGSLRCDCGAQLDRSIETLHAQGGILLYLRQEGRGLGLLAKLDAYELQDRGLDTFDANRALLHPDDARNYVCGAEMLRPGRDPRPIDYQQPGQSRAAEAGRHRDHRTCSGRHVSDALQPSVSGRQGTKSGAQPRPLASR